MTYNLFIDDCRVPADIEKSGALIPHGLEWIVAKSIRDVISIIKEHGDPIIVSFDYYLSGNETGAEAARVLCSLVNKIPVRYYVHSTADMSDKQKIHKVIREARQRELDDNANK